MSARPTRTGEVIRYALVGLAFDESPDKQAARQVETSGGYVDWIAVELMLPTGEALLWAGGRCRVGIAVPRHDPNEAIVFLDPVSDALLPTATHWCALPDPPKG